MTNIMHNKYAKDDYKLKLQNKCLNKQKIRFKLNREWYNIITSELNTKFQIL